MRVLLRRVQHLRPLSRCFSSSAIRREIRDVAELPDSICPAYQETTHHDLLALQWPCPPRNLLIVRKEGSKRVDEALQEYVTHINSTYPDMALIFEPGAANELHELFSFPIYTTNRDQERSPTLLQNKVDLATTLGGDGTILHASSLFATSRRVPPILSFSMGTLGFLGEWKFDEYKRAFREVYMSGAIAGAGSSLLETEAEHHERKSSTSPQSSQVATLASNGQTLSGWSSVRGKSMGSSRGSRVLLRNRLKVGIYDANGERIAHQDASQSVSPVENRPSEDVYAMNEVLIHRGRTPHLSVISIFVGGRFLTESVADGMLISTPTGSTAYSLSAGGSIVHPLVSSLLLTPISPRSLSFRPLVLPANTPITLRLSEHNRSQEVEVSIDGVRRSRGLEKGMEVRVVGEEIKSDKREWTGGVPSVVRAGGCGGVSGEDHWVGGLNGLLKFNYPFGEDT